ncbi:hypothetical protein EV127DRAFT_405320 [Xylaria flabelliformis]|nr:hypothetical protein EV127DRAFT_405320 [Xylaria flabelliformis]
MGILTRARYFRHFLTGSRKNDNNRQRRQAPPKVVESGKSNVQPSHNTILSACEADQKYEQLRLDYERLSEQHEQSKLEQERLSIEKQTLKNTVNMRESQILILRPYSTRYTRSEARNEYRFLLNSIKDWVEEWTDKLTDNTDFSKHWMDSLNHFPQVTDRLRQFLGSNPDLASAVGYADSDQDIIFACIVRFITQRIFGTVPCSISLHTSEVLRDIENHMASCTEPELDPSAVCSWRGQAFHALFSHPQYSAARQKGIDTLSADLTHIFGFLFRSSNNEEFIRSISSKIVEPSLRLYENFRRSNEEYYFETVESIKPGARMSQDFPAEQLRELLNDLDCRNAIRCNAIFRVEKLKAKPTDEELRHHLYFICSINPALKVRGHRSNYGQDPETLLKEKVLVAWDPDKLQGRDPCMLKSQTWLSRICSN